MSATQISSTTRAHDRDSQGVHTVTWPNMPNGSEGAPVKLAMSADRSVQVFGTPGASGNVRIEGSNNGSNWTPLHDPQGLDLNITAAKIEAISEASLYVRPVVTAGDDTTDLTVIILTRTT